MEVVRSEDEAVEDVFEFIVLSNSSTQLQERSLLRLNRDPLLSGIELVACAVLH